jgi:hypothetical protein
MSIENQPTQRIRRPDDGSTDVLSLDNLFEGPPAAEVTTTPTAPPVASAQPIASTQPVDPTQTVDPAEPLPPTPVERRMANRRMADRRLGDRRADALPAAPPPAPRQPGAAHRLQRDATVALRGGAARTGHWFTTGDNALIVATALVALALILVVGLI